MGLFDKISEDLKVAMKAGEKTKVGVYRMMISDIKKAAIDAGKREEISDELVIAALTKGVKSRMESVTQYRSANREDLAAKEQDEIDLISAYLPPPLTDEELAVLVGEAIGETGASGKRDMGRVMKVVMPQVQGRADGKKVQQMVLEQLGNA